MAEERRRQAEISVLESHINMAMMLEEKREVGEAIKQYRLIKAALREKQLDIFPFVDLAIWRAQYNDGRSVRVKQVLNDDGMLSHRAAFSPDNRTLAVACVSGTIQLWDRVTGELTGRVEGETEPVYSLAFSPDGSRLISASCDTSIKLWNIGEDREIATLRGHETDIYSMDLSPDGTVLVTGGKDRTVRFWDLERQMEIAVFKEHKQPVESVVFSPDGRMVASAGKRGMTILWSLEKESMVKTIDLTFSGYKIISLAYSPDGTMLTAGPWGNKLVPLLLIDPDTGTVIDDLMTIGGRTSSVKFNPEGSLLAVGSEDGLLRIADVENRELLAMINVHKEKHSTFLSALMTTVELLNKKPKEIWKNVNEVTFSPDGSVLATVCDDGTVKLWDVNSYRLIHSFEGYSQEMFALDYSPDGRFLAAGGREHTVFIWDTQNRELIATLAGHTHSIRSLVFSPDGTVLATGSKDRTIKLWQFGGALRPLEFE